MNEYDEEEDEEDEEDEGGDIHKHGYWSRREESNERPVRLAHTAVGDQQPAQGKQTR